MYLREPAPHLPLGLQDAADGLREVLVVLPGLLLAMMLAMLDNFIVGTAMRSAARPDPTCSAAPATA
jgi:hypothetical protein